MRWIDVSTPQNITAAWCAARVTEEPTGLCVNTWFGNHSPADVETALELAHDAGMLTAIYYVPHIYQTPGFHWTNAKAVCGQQLHYLSFVAIDVEDIRSGDPLVQQWSEPHIRQSVALIEVDGLRPIIYSNKSAWAMDNSLSDLPLWVADYDGDPAITLRFPFGGWTSAAGKQYLGDTDIDGVHCDVSTFSDAWLTEGEMTTEQRADIDRIRLIAASNKQRLVEQKDKIEAGTVNVPPENLGPMNDAIADGQTAYNELQTIVELAEGLLH